MKSLKKKAGKMSFTNKKTSYARGNNFLHGQLLIKIISAENLPDLEGIFRVTFPPSRSIILGFLNRFSP